MDFRKRESSNPNLLTFRSTISEERDMKTIVTLLIVATILVAGIGIAVVVINNNDDKTDGTVTVKDMLGKEVTVKKNPKVACSSRMTYDLLIAFGLKDYVDGGQYAIYDNKWTYVLNPDASNDYSYAYLESYETFFERGIDLVFSPEAYITQDLIEHGVTAMNVSLYGNPDYGPYLYFLADLADKLWDGISDKVIEWKGEFKKAIDNITEVLNQKGKVDQKLYYVRGDKNNGVCYTDTGLSFCEWMAKFFGFTYLGSTFETTRPSTEALLAANPDVIVIGGIYQYTLEEQLGEATWSELSAVQSGKIYRIPVGISPFEQISTFSPVFLYLMANTLYPTYFDFDIQGMIKDCCQKYFGISLTDAQAGYMLDGLDPEGNKLV